MNNSEHNPMQESTSVYFNNIIRRNVAPVTAAELDPSLLERFNRQIELAFADEALDATKRLHYLIPYIIQNIDWVEYATPLNVDGHIELRQLDKSLTGGSHYDATGFDDFSLSRIWVCPVTLCVLGRYPKYLYVKKM